MTHRRAPFRLDSAAGLHIFAIDASVMRDLRRRARAEESLPTFEPCLPRPALVPPAGPGWIHEIKHDGFRILAHRRGRSVQLLTRNGNDFADRFPRITEAIEALPVKSCVVDGEAIVCDGEGVAVFDLIRGHGRNGQAVLCAFDLIEENGEDLRRELIEDRKRRLAGLLRLQYDGITDNEGFTGEDHLSPRLRARLRGHRVQAHGLALPGWPFEVVVDGGELMVLQNTDPPSIH
jgi:bifunctional non-homologous end joining protein LigD